VDGEGGEGYVRFMTKALGGRPKIYDGDKEVSEEAKELARGLVEGLSTNMRQLVKFGNDLSMTPRQKQKLASEISVSLFMQPLWRARFADWSMENPGEAAKLALSQVPKEIHVEQNVNHSVVLLPAGMSSEEWLARNEEIEEAEIVPWLSEKAQ